MQRLGAEHAVVVYGRDGMDEVSLGAATMAVSYTHLTLPTSDLGVNSVDAGTLKKKKDKPT